MTSAVSGKVADVGKMDESQWRLCHDEERERREGETVERQTQVQLRQERERGNKRNCLTVKQSEQETYFNSETSLVQRYSIH